MTKRLLKISAGIGAAIFSLFLVTSLLSVGTAQAQAPTATPTATPDPNVQQTVNTTAVLGSNASGAPTIECKWELPDMQVGVSSPGYPDPLIQYQLNATTGAHVHDDDMAVVPSTSPACTLQTVGGITAPAMSNNVHNMIQVVPVPQDQPEFRKIQLWMAVDSSDLTQVGVYWDVYEPALPSGLCKSGVTPEADGMCFKIQVHGTMVPKSACDPTSAQSLGNATSTGKMFEAAVDTGQISAAAVDDPNNGMRALCSEQVKGLFYSTFLLSKEQACGEYKINATAASTLGGTSPTLTNYIDVECVTYLKIDFSSINWTDIRPNSTGQVTGNLAWESPNSIRPTVMNVGNDGMGLGLIFSPMVGTNAHKLINTFDACFGKAADSTLECIGYTAPYIQANTLTEFGTAPAQVLCADESGKLDLSIHPVSTPALVLPDDTYVGTLTVIGRHVPGVCWPNPDSE